MGPLSDPVASLGTAGMRSDAAKAGQSGGAAGTRAAPAVGQASPSVAVSVSREARTLAAAGAGDADGDMDMAKVEAFRSAIAEGRFKVNAGAIADKLLANAQEMLDHARAPRN